MGLHQDHFRFDGVLPDLATVRAEARRRLGDDSGIEDLCADGRTVIVCCMLDPFTRPVVCAILQEMGGQCVDRHGQPKTVTLPRNERSRLRVASAPPTVG